MTAVRSVTGDANGEKRRAPPIGLSLWYSAAGSLPPARNSSAEPVVVAVEGGHSAADEVLEVSGVLMVDRSGLIDEMWCT